MSPLIARPQVAVLVINRDRPDLTDQVCAQLTGMGTRAEVRLFVVDAGSRPAGLSRHTTHRFRSRVYRGRYHAFNRALEFARRERDDWDFYWFVCNDVAFPVGEDTLGLLLDAMASDPQMAAISPGEPDADDYQGCHPKPGRAWHKASTLHGLAMLMRATAVREVGYCNPAFRYSQGAGTELAYKLYSAGWFLAYSDLATLRHAGGSTYGVVVPISRHEYQRRARQFASTYLKKHYGTDWDARFSAMLPADVEVDTFPWQRQVWDDVPPRNWKEFHPWFWRAGSAVKRMLRRSGLLHSHD